MIGKIFVSIQYLSANKAPLSHNCFKCWFLKQEKCLKLTLNQRLTDNSVIGDSDSSTEALPFELFRPLTDPSPRYIYFWVQKRQLYYHQYPQYSTLNYEQQLLKCPSPCLCGIRILKSEMSAMMLLLPSMSLTASICTEEHIIV